MTSDRFSKAARANSEKFLDLAIFYTMTVTLSNLSCVRAFFNLFLLSTSLENLDYDTLLIEEPDRCEANSCSLDLGSAAKEACYLVVRDTTVASLTSFAGDLVLLTDFGAYISCGASHFSY